MQTFFDRLMGWLLALCLAAMTGVVFTAVVFRYVLNSPLDWTGELASLLFAWLTFAGAYVGSRSRSHVRIDALTLLLPVRAQQILQRLADVGVLLLLGIFIWQGCSLTWITRGLEYPAMEISRGYLYASLPVGAGLMLVAIFLSWREDRRGGTGRGPAA
jgi:TRAP-type C4-dicarboxylate transport system permease small subunit